MKPPTIAAIVVTRDRPQLLRDALASIAAQRLSPLEVRIADDGDVPAFETAEGAGLLEVTLLPSQMGQAGAARNLAAQGARSDVLAFLDDDDRWLPDHLAGLGPAFAEPEVELAFRDVAVIRERLGDGGERIELERRVIARDWDPCLMRRDDYIPPSAWGVRRALFERLGGFDPAFRFSEDWDFLLRAGAVTAPRRVPGTTVEVRLRDIGNSSTEHGPERRACLDELARRHAFAPPEIKTFWEVAREVGRGPAGG
ncbi:MAG TPA: glycosyltransferase family A protein [Candidatus Eisenbacteria bacterium]|jgi:glycosyltransferase involved in cell wall biosynthesis